MADKHIKDGIDVGQCKYYSIEHDDCARTLSGSCMKEKCQTFRLLQTIQAKEQECEGLEYDYQNQLKNTNKWIVECENLQQQLKHKEQECEELKKTIMYKCPQCGEKYLSPIGASLYEENKKLEQTLIEIKEIIKQGVKIHDDIIVNKQILQKISECKVEND